MIDTIKDILIYIKSNITHLDKVEDIAKRFGYSKFYFSRSFKKLTGFSAQSFISALKLEHSIEEIVTKQQSVLNAQLNAGFLSSGSFTQTFEQQTGLTPKMYQKQLISLYGMLLDYEQQHEMVSTYRLSQTHKKGSTCIVSIQYPDHYVSGITFIGLFKTPIPNHKPVVGLAINGNGIALFDKIPDGKYYLLGCSIKPGSQLTDYFVLKTCLRGVYDKQLEFPRNHQSQHNFVMRDPLPHDQPITINLPMLLASIFKHTRKH